MFIKNGSFKKYTHIITYVPVEIIQQPLSGVASLSGTFTFTIKTKGSAPISYQWYRNNFPLAGQITDTLTLSNIQLSNDSDYYCRVRNTRYAINSNFARLSVIN